MVNYNYDAWGNTTYVLNENYTLDYNPTIGIFISIDDTKYLDFEVLFGY